MDQSTGVLTEVAGSPFTAGTHPISIAIDPSGHYVYVANHGSDNISIFSLDKSTGSLTPISGSPFAIVSKPHSVAIDRQGRFAYATSSFDGGGTYIFAIDSGSGKLAAISGSPVASATSGWHTLIDPSGKLLFQSYEGFDISVFTIDRTTGAITIAPGSPHATGRAETGAIALAPSGEFVYVLDQWAGITSVFSVNSTTGELTEIAGSPFNCYQSLTNAGFTSDWLDGIAIDPAGEFLYITSSNASVASPQHIQAFSIDENTGSLSSVSGSLLATGGASAFAYDWCTNPSIDPTGTFLYVTNSGSNDIAGYTINRATGILTPLSGSTFPAGTCPGMIVTVQIP
jgi:6-phosphogluconolactonase (cycloisomerase 2 family)